MIDLLGDALPLVLFFLLLLFGCAVAFALAISGAVGLWLLVGTEATLGVIQTIPFRTTSSFVLVTIGMFVLMAELTSQSGITGRLFTAANAFVGHLKGGLGMATVLASAAFGTLSGSSVAAAATMSRVAIPEMLARGYSKSFSAGTTSIAGTLAIVIPPSIPLVIFGILTETSISKLLLAGVLPGILTAASYVVTIIVWTRLNPSVAPAGVERPTTREKWETCRFLWPFLLVLVLVFAGLYSGAVTTTEASAVGATSVFLVWALLSRVKSAGLNPVSFTGLKEAFDRTLRSTVMIVVLLIGAYIFSFYITNTGATQLFIDRVAHLDMPRVVILLGVILLYLVLGCFMSQLEIMILTLPFVFPLVVKLGYDPIWFGIIVVKTIEMGLVTPPVGMNVFVVASASRRVSAADGFKGVTPFLAAETVVLVILILAPDIALLIPRMMG
jgi:tripartite ATP-independent transporter DctM subunit